MYIYYFNILTSPYLEAAVHSSNRFPIIFALGRGSSYDVLLHLNQ